MCAMLLFVVFYAMIRAAVLGDAFELIQYDKFNFLIFTPFGPIYVGV